jgi:hypothetical protein
MRSSEASEIVAQKVSKEHKFVLRKRNEGRNKKELAAATINSVCFRSWMLILEKNMYATQTFKTVFSRHEFPMLFCPKLSPSQTSVDFFGKVLRIRIRDLLPFWHLDPVSGMG